MNRSRAPFMNRFTITLLLMACLAPLGHAAEWTVSGQLRSDRWHYPFNFTPGSRQSGALFILNASDSQNFNRRDGLAIVQWELAIPSEVPANYEIAAATLTFWDRRQAAYSLGTFTEEGVEQRLEVFPARFNAPYTEDAWTGTEPFIGGTGTGPKPRNPWPIDLVTSASVENDVTTSTPWAIGEPIGYTPGAMTDAFPIVFRFDLTNPTIRQEFKDDLESGFSSWFLSAAFEIDAIDVSLVPQILFSESIANTGFGVSQQAPSLEVLLIEPEIPLSVESWGLYE